METTTITNAVAIDNSAQNSNKEHTDLLIKGFKNRFPNEISKVYISKKTLTQAIGNNAKVSGLRFMYGFESVNKDGIKVLSRTVLLIPCTGSLKDGDAGKFIIQKEYLTHSGKLVSFEKTKQSMYNHAIRFASYFPEEKFNRIMRGSYVDINILNSLLNAEGCSGFNFNFGYDETVADVPLRNKPVIEAVDSLGNCLELSYLNFPCPPWCDALNMPCPPWCGAPSLFDVDHN